ncbi:hypothetical protein L2E82_13529 [Cichorium intybus]|uniref:Uncharacterized protein n=1 Tax=Cichorium intybus TaxID=13427 RepID=A0ACB9EX21_CICIN|nr:hypothetical protein L2E82_13529 [Cichorium intybus]
MLKYVVGLKLPVNIRIKLCKMFMAQAESEGKTAEPKKPILVKYGLNNINFLTEQNMAQFVIIAHDVDPIEFVVCIPALCRKIEIPYCIVKGKSRLGTIVHQKTENCSSSVLDYNQERR